MLSIFLISVVLGASASRTIVLEDACVTASASPDLISLCFDCFCPRNVSTCPSIANYSIIIAGNSTNFDVDLCLTCGRNFCDNDSSAECVFKWMEQSCKAAAVAVEPFKKLNSPFCEGQQLGYRGNDFVHEIGGALSNGLYIFLGLMHSVVSVTTDDLCQLISGSIVAVGIGSWLYHGTFWSGFGTFDGLPMVAIVSLLLIGLTGALTSKVKGIALPALYVIEILYLALYAANEKTGIPGGVLNSTVIFTIPIILLIVFLVVFFIYELVQSRSSKIAPTTETCNEMKMTATSNPLEIVRLMRQVIGRSGTSSNLSWILLRAIVMISIALFFKILDSGMCDDTVVYLFFHMWWHICSADSVACTFVVICWIRGNENLYYHPVIHWFPSNEIWWLRWYPTCPWALEPYILARAAPACIMADPLVFSTLKAVVSSPLSGAAFDAVVDVESIANASMDRGKSASMDSKLAEDVNHVTPTKVERFPAEEAEPCRVLYGCLQRRVETTCTMSSGMSRVEEDDAIRAFRAINAPSITVDALLQLCKPPPDVRARIATDLFLTERYGRQLCVSDWLDLVRLVRSTSAP